METELYQICNTDIWGSHSSRNNLGVFSSVLLAVLSVVEKETHLINGIFRNDDRLFVEKITVDEVEGYSKVFDSEQQDDNDFLKKIIFFHVINRFKMLEISEIDFLGSDVIVDIDAINCVDDVTKEMIEEFLSEENVNKFLKNNL